MTEHLKKLWRKTGAVSRHLVGGRENMEKNPLKKEAGISAPDMLEKTDEPPHFRMVAIL